MNRREALKAISFVKSSKKGQNRAFTFTGGICPFSGNFDYQTARHLLNRCNFGATNEQILQAVEDGLESTLDQILSAVIPVTLPLNPSFEEDPNVPIGETWVGQPFAGGLAAVLYRIYSLQNWTYEQLSAQNISVQEKMTLFWHNQFAIHDIKDARFGYRYASTLRDYSLGNFKDLVKAICIDPMMLLFLNGHDNSVIAPNENFARELLELFTIGKGELVGPGEYTHYTEADISELSKALTGWQYIGRYSTITNEPDSVFRAERHDDTEKVLSDRFNNEIIQPAGELEYSNVVDIIFQQEEVAKFLCRKIYRWFVYYEIDETIEEEVIAPLAELLRNENYEVEPVLRTLFSSEHFLDESRFGCQIKNPLDFIIGINKTCEVKLESDLVGRYQQFGLMSGFSDIFQMSSFNPPSVAGWKAYYQEPVFYQHWLNSVTLPFRIRYTKVVTSGGATLFGTPIYVVDPLPLVAKLELPSDVNRLLQQLIRLLFPKPLSAGQILVLKNTLLGDLDDFEWETEYLEYFIDPTNENLAAPIRSRLKNLFTAMTEMAEFQLM